MRITLFFLLLGILCFARDNPFEPVEDIARFTKVPKQDNYFKKASFALPDSARILKKIDLYYQNLDGSISRKIIKIDKKVDWHNKLTLTYGGTQNIQKKYSAVKKRKTVVSKDSIKKFGYKGFISFRVSKKRIEIITKDSKIRDFMVDKPYKVVVDFKRDTNFLTKTFKLDIVPFVSVVLGNHDKYYRVAIELDGQYLYNVKRKKGEYIITLK